MRLIYKSVISLFLILGLLSTDDFSTAAANTILPAPSTVTVNTLTKPAPPQFGIAIIGESSIDIELGWLSLPVNIYMNGAKVNNTPYQGVDYPISNLTPGVTYRLSVTTVDGENESDQAIPIEVTVLAKPTNVKATTGDKAATLTWDPVVGASGYYVYSSLLENGRVSPAPVTGTSFTVTNLQNGGTSWYYIRAVDAYGHESLESQIVTATPVSSIPPTTPDNLQVANGDKSVTLSWNPASDHGQLGGIAYDVYMNGQKQTVVNNTSYTATNLVNGMTYSFAVKAINNFGLESPLSASVTDTVIEMPVNVQTSPGLNQLTISWNNPTEKDIAGFNIYDRNTGKKANASLITRNTYTVTGLTNGTMYFFSVSAVTKNGVVSRSVPTGGMPQYPVPGSPQNLVATEKNGQVDLQWSPSPYAVTYSVYEYGREIANQINSTSYTVNQLKQGGNYLFYVVANNAAGTSNPSAEISVLVLDPDKVNVLRVLSVSLVLSAIIS